MRKQGPCYHCGARETPLWRHGPMEKPVLCNACGSRWRTKGSLDDYTPKRYRSVVRKRRSQNTGDVYEDERVHEQERIVNIEDVISDMQDDNQVPPVMSSFEHIESLQKELYEMYIYQRCASTIAASELIYDNLNGGLRHDNEVGLGVVMLNAPIVAREEKSGPYPFLWKKNVLASQAKTKGEDFLRKAIIDSSQHIATPQAPADPKERHKSVAEVSLAHSSFVPGGDLSYHVHISAGGVLKTKNEEPIGKPAPGSSSVDGDVSCTRIGKEYIH